MLNKIKNFVFTTPKVNKTELYKYAPKSCEIGEPFSCRDFILDKESHNFMLTLKYFNPRDIGADIINFSIDKDNIDCDSSFTKLDSKGIFYIELYNCTFYKNFAEFLIFYKYKNSNLLHTSKGLVTLGFSSID